MQLCSLCSSLLFWESLWKRGLSREWRSNGSCWIAVWDQYLLAPYHELWVFKSTLKLIFCESWDLSKLQEILNTAYVGCQLLCCGDFSNSLNPSYYFLLLFFPPPLYVAFSLCARPASSGYGRDRKTPSKAKAYSFQVCLYRGWVRHRRRGAPHCNAQSLQRVLVMESKMLSAAKLQLFWWLCLLRIIRLVQYRHTHGCLYSFCNGRAHAGNPLWAPVKT